MTPKPVLDFKSASLFALRVVLHAADTAALRQALIARLDAAGDFFQDEPVVIDASQLQAAPDWATLARVLHDRELALVGIHAPEALRQTIQAAGLACVNLSPVRDGGHTDDAGGSVHRDPDVLTLETRQAGVALPAAEPDLQAPAIATSVPEVAASPLPRPAPEVPRTTLILDRSLRSGQKVYARHADLVVVGMVSPGAEIIADGSIHVYGPLRGKAMAGARGDEGARIFTTQLDAELVAVAGVYRVIETRLPAEIHQRPASVRLQDGQLHLHAMAI